MAEFARWELIPEKHISEFLAVKKVEQLFSRNEEDGGTGNGPRN
jgi:hypothetical protein